MNTGTGKKIFLTGATGFLGAYILKELVRRKYTVRAIRRSSTLPFFIDRHILDPVEWIQGDILDPVLLDEAMAGVDGVIHAAAKVSFYKKERSDLYQTNINGTANIVNAAIAHNIPRLVHISSVAALGRKDDGMLIDEGEQWEENQLSTHYAISKYQGEMEVWRGIGEGLNAVILNPSTIIGYGDWNTTSCAIFKNVYEEFPWYTTGTNGFVNVNDVAALSVMMLESGIRGERFIISSENWNFQDLFNTIADGFSKKHPYREATPFLGAIAWRFEKIKSLFTGIRPLLTRETAKIAQSNTRFDNSKIRKFIPDFDFTPIPVTISEACATYLQSLQPHHGK